MNVSVRSYLSPTLVLLAFDWPEGGKREDFLGFAIKRTPGFLAADGHEREASSWLPNRLTFKGAVPDTQKDAPTNKAPIQKFMWWDARIDEADREKSFTYLIYPVVGRPEAPQLLDAQKGECKLTLPAHVEANVGSWFNRAVVSSQAFARKVAALHLAPNAAPSPEQALRLRTWLANDLQEVFDAHARSCSSRGVGGVPPDRSALGDSCLRGFRQEAGQSITRHCLRLARGVAEGQAAGTVAESARRRRSSPMSPRSRRATRRTSCMTSSSWWTTAMARRHRRAY